MSVKVRVVAYTVASMGVLAAIVAGVGCKLYYDNLMESYTAYAGTVLEYADRAAVARSFGDMIAERAMPAGYEELRHALDEVKESSDIEYLYAVYFEDADDPHSLHYAINAKTAEEVAAAGGPSLAYTDMGQPVEEGAFEDDTLAVLWQAVRDGKADNGFIDGHSDVYGHMLNGYRVVFDGAGNAAGLLCVEIGINRINDGLARYVRTVALLAAILTAIVVTAYLVGTQRNLVGPVERIAASSSAFVRKMRDGAGPDELVFDEPRVGSGRELAVLAGSVADLAGSVASYMANLESATAERERMSAELALAAHIQESILPRVFPPYPDIQSFDVYAIMDAAREVGGDFYDFFLIGEATPEAGRLGFVVADVSGKGVPAALFMMKAKTQVRDYLEAGMGPGEAVENANRQLCDGNDAGMFVTAWVGVLDYASGRVEYVNAGHNPPLLWQSEGAGEEFSGSWRWLRERSGLPLGLFEGLPYETFALECRPGDMLLLYTDGVTEATSTQGELFGEEGLEELARRSATLHPRGLVRAVRAGVAGYAAGAEQSDDITVLALEVGVPPEEKAVLDVPADVGELDRVNEFIHGELDRRLCPVRAQKQLDIAVEELFVNSCCYAYEGMPEDVERTVRVTRAASAEPPSVTVEIIDAGTPFDPLARPDAARADEYAGVAEVPIGGLGILMAKKSVDEMRYERADGRNVVTLVKRW